MLTTLLQICRVPIIRTPPDPHRVLNVFIGVILFACPAAMALPPADSLKITPGADSLAAPRDSTSVQDSTGRMSTPSLVGTLDRNLDAASVRSRQELHWMDYRYLGDILESFPGSYVRDQHSEGQYNQISFNGSDWRSIAFSVNGRTVNDPASGIFNLYQFTTEYADRIEVVTGPRAFLYGLNSTGGAVNLVTKNYNSNKPFTKLDYSEGAYGYAYTDGTFSQNISRKVNVTFGFQHQATDGRYINSNSDAWNGRAKVRYNVSHDLNIIFAYYYMATQTGLTGGIDLLKSGNSLAFDARQATLINPDSYEKTSHHDVDLSFVGTFLRDTSNVTMLTLYSSYGLREYRDEENRATPNGIVLHSDHVSSWMGALMTQNIYAGMQRLSLGATIELRQIEGSPNLGRRRDVIGAAWGTEELLVGDHITVAGFARADRYLGRSSLGLGADAALQLGQGIKLFAGLSSSRRMPNYQELYWADSTVSRPGVVASEQHTVAEAGALLTFDDRNSLRVSYVHRTVNDPILFLPSAGVGSPFPSLRIENGPAVSSDGISARIALRFWYLAFEGTALFVRQVSGGQTLDDEPTLSGNGGLYFWSKLLADKLELKGGLRGTFALSHRGMVYNPEVIAYLPGAGPSLGTSSTIDFFLIAHIGDAYVHFMWENLTNVHYFGTPFYPGGERALRFGISWEFLN